VRFDDMLATVLAQPARTQAGLCAKWRQLVDLLAQRRGSLSGEQVDAALSFLAEHRDDVDPATRKEVGAALAGRQVSPLLIRFFGEDQPSVALPVIATARLAPDEWLELLPSLTVTARALLRHRRDLHPRVSHALQAFGASDFVLAARSEAGPPEQEQGQEGAVAARADAGEPQIRELVERIEAFRRSRQSEPVERAGQEPAASFRWETGPDGVIQWVEGAPREALVGQSIAAIAEAGDFGVDGQAAGAFERRAPFRDARFRVAGSGPASGDWRISGVPFFDQRQGSFLGYRGSARRPRLDEVAMLSMAQAQTGLFGTDLPADALRQLIHELRTPLNAILGFAEMIDGQYMGPAAANYRSRAREIMDQASRLLSAVDDLDTAARIETQRLVVDASAIDPVALLHRLHGAYERVADQRRARIGIELAPGLPPARVEPATAERMFSRLLAGTIGLAQEGETISARMTAEQVAGQDMLCFAIDRPDSIAGLEEASLLDPGYSPEGDWPGAPALGLGFALRLVRNLADAVGGALVIGEDRFFLYLPTLRPAEQTTIQGG